MIGVMTLILHLGVADVPYNLRPSRRRKSAAGTKTTGDVAEILEAKYHIMEVFFEEEKTGIAADLEDGLVGAVESLMMGAPVRLDPFGSGTSAIEDRFKTFLSTSAIEKLGIPGVPTQAAIQGVSHRLKRPRAKTNPRRPSFIDTGLFQASFKSWVEVEP